MFIVAVSGTGPPTRFHSSSRARLMASFSLSAGTLASPGIRRKYESTLFFRSSKVAIS